MPPSALPIGVAIVCALKRWSFGKVGRIDCMTDCGTGGPTVLGSLNAWHLKNTRRVARVTGLAASLATVICTEPTKPHQTRQLFSACEHSVLNSGLAPLSADDMPKSNGASFIAWMRGRLAINCF